MQSHHLVCREGCCQPRWQSEQVHWVERQNYQLRSPCWMFVAPASADRCTSAVGNDTDSKIGRAHV